METQLKQILYGCVEHVQATKAALYLSSSLDLNDKRFELVTSYQYNVADRKTVDAKDDLVDSLAVKRNAFFVNGLGGDQRFAEMQFRQGTDRLLAAPLFARGRLLGFIDMRDKAGKKPFENNDLEAARKIAEEVISLLSSKRMFGLAPIQLVETTPVPNAPPPQPVAPTRAASVLSPAALRAIESAHEYISRRQYLQTARRLVTQGDLEVIHLLLPAALAFRTATLTAFTAVGPAFTTQAIAARGPVTNDAVNRLNEHLLVWLQRKNIKVPSGRSLPMFVYPFGTQGSPVGAPSLDSMLTATVNAPSIEGLLLTVAFDVPPDVDTQHALESYLRQVEESVESAIGASAGRGERQAIAEKLLEPDFQKLPDLA
ncbi:MAG TPA: GAF domain-containing protein, partial [Thermoanaerobaculia bacterium]